MTTTVKRVSWAVLVLLATGTGLVAKAFSMPGGQGVSMPCGTGIATYGS